MGLRKNIAINFISQIYIAVIGVALLPLYASKMGGEAYGLIGFYTMLQAWFALLDLGLTPTVSRQSTCFKAGVTSVVDYLRVLRALLVFFFAISLLGFIILYFSANFISTRWLNVQHMSSSDVLFSLEVMAGCVVFRWFGGLPRGLITGYEQIKWLSIFAAVMSTARFVLVFFSMSIWGFTAPVFFAHQLLVALLEVAVLSLKSYFMIPGGSALGSEKIGWSLKPILPLLKFSGVIAVTSSVWMVVTQLDKLILSGVLSLEDYGHYSLAVLLASAVLLVSTSVGTVVMPKLARLHAEFRQAELIATYRDATRIVAIGSGVAALLLCFFGRALLEAWTDDRSLAKSVEDVLVLYSLGNAFLSVSAFAYYIQYAFGQLRYHLIGNLLMLFFMIPIIGYVSVRFGAIGAAWVWFSLNLAYLVFWVSFTHSKIVPGLNFDWYFKDILLMVFPSVLLVGCVSRFVSLEGLGRFEIVFLIAGLGILALFVSLLVYYFSSKMVRFGVQSEIVR